MSTKSINRDEPKTRKSKGKKDGKGEEEKCKACGTVIDSNSKAISCNFCEKWLCIECLGISAVLYKELVGNPDAPVIIPCKDCSSHVASMNKMSFTLNEVKSRQDDTFRQLNDLSKEMSSLNNELKKTVQKAVKEEVSMQIGLKMEEVERALESKMNKRLNEMENEVKGATSNMHQDDTKKIQEIVTEALNEDKEREKRKPNLMMFRVPESSSIDSQERIEYDKKIAAKVLRHLEDRDDIIGNIKRVFRMGRKHTEQSIRPLKIVFDNPDTKYNFLRNSYKLSAVDDESVRNISISNDRTPTEISQYRKLREELDRRTSEGESNLKIQKGRIVSIKEGDGPSVPGKLGRRGRPTRRDKQGESNDANKAKDESDSDEEELNLSRESTTSVPIGKMDSGSVPILARGLDQLYPEQGYRSPVLFSASQDQGMGRIRTTVTKGLKDDTSCL